MQLQKAQIRSQLQNDIFLLQGFKPSNTGGNDVGLGIIKQVFPYSTFPTGAIHEFFYNGSEDASSSCGFITGILSSLMKKGGATLWISSSKSLFPPALKNFGVEPEQIIFIHLKKDREKLWVMEEALKCKSLSCVIGEINDISFTESRRFQLAVEQTGVTGFVLRENPKNLSTAFVTRWKIKPLATEKTDLPGIGFPRWNVELLKVRNGKPGSWQMEWKSTGFRLVQQPAIITVEEQRKII